MKFNVGTLYSILVVVFIAFLMSTFYAIPASGIARGSGTVLSDNWWEALNWIRENTKECAVEATYWDPGHFITAIAKRPVVFDGAQQNSVLVIDKIGNVTESDLKNLAPTGKYTIKKEYIDGIEHNIVTRARIQDIGTTLLTDDEELAYKILKWYRKPDCDEMYFIASSDLVSKAHWWSYFSTWNPVDKGTPYNYLTATLTQARPVVQQNAIAYMYVFAEQQAFIIYDRNDTLEAFLQRGNQVASVEKIFYMKRNGQTVMNVNSNAQIRGTVWLDASRQVMVFIPPELEGSMFTRMFFYNGLGLERFEFVNNWGGEVKLFRIRFDEPANFTLGKGKIIVQ